MGAVVPVTLLLGGARSGKSRLAETLAKESGKAVCYLATAPRYEEDAEWQSRIVKHQQQRPQHWQVIEEPLDLVGALDGEQHQTELILVDCLTLWLSNLMFAEKDVTAEVDNLCKMLAAYAGDVVLVSNEVGMGLAAESSLGRQFCDEQGRLNQAVAEAADHVLFVAAGLPLTLK